MSHLAAVKGIKMPKAKSDHYFTPGYLFRPLHHWYRFTLDPCGNELSPVTQLIGRACVLPHHDGLRTNWAGERIFCNPPYSHIAPWVWKGAASMLSGCELVVYLLPANKSEQPWWQKYIERFRDGRKGPYRVDTYHHPGRISFGTPENPEGSRSGGTFPSVWVIFRPLRSSMADYEISKAAA